MSLSDSKKVAAIVADAGGRVVGRTRLQKIAYLLTVTGMEDGLSFYYKHYGPYCEDLASAASLGALFGELKETESPTTWGGTYSIFEADRPHDLAPASDVRRQFASTAARSDSIVLELAATAVFLAKEGFDDPWAETARRKPEKAIGNRLADAKNLLKALSEIETPRPLPNIA
ncbi:hypothetical protein [Roseibium salinum]|uniref:Uncharacterized protein n=1 Tax=Roseibium salinum TaxID=1604349 RepID=A0ABT3R2T9_9HYPH|nr:hypothetical protein [Roseibium sp. DSM 29163]MCX2723494.1 hypothetical protein [Roseibium sp. DSM 29163]